MVGVVASARLVEQPVAGKRSAVQTAQPPAPAPTGAAGQERSEIASADSLDRPVDEIRTFFGYPRTRPAGRDREKPARPPVEVSRLALDIRTMATNRGYELRFLVALVPDPIGSYVGGQFDTYATALLRGGAASGWLPDRHWLPWRETEPSSAGGAEARAQTAARYSPSPGIILFRDSSSRVLLTALIVRESPISGIHKRAFVDALLLISAVQPDAPLQILGPFSSGAAGSCSLALEDWYRRSRPPRPNTIRFLSGSATGPEVAERLKPRCEGCGSLSVEFRRTVVSDVSLQREAFEFFEKQLGWHHEEIALLAENDTAYGQTSGQEPRHWRLLLPVPSALSTVRVASERSRKAEEVEVGGIRVAAPTVELKLDEARAPRDSLPLFDPMTAPINELELDSLLSTLAREKIRHLGLVFTDIRDTLFVAQEIKESAPHVSIFTFGSSVLYVHPRVNPYTDGMLVVSSYPLSMVPQQLFGGTSGTVGRRVQFGSDPEQGLYNAVVIALSERGRPPSVVDYPTIPGTTARAPGVWISAVGDGRLVPLALRRLPGNGQASGRWASTAGKGTLAPELQTIIRRLEIPSGFRFVFWVATVVFLVVSFSVLAAYSKSETIPRPRLSEFFRPLRRSGSAERRQQRWWTAALVGVVSATWTALAAVYLVPSLLRGRWGLRAEVTGDLEHGDWIGSLEGFFLPALTKLLPMIALLLVALVTAVGWFMDRRDESRRPVFAVLLGSSMAATLILSAQAVGAFRSAPPDRLDQAVFTFLRTSAGSGNLSPLAGILLLAVGIGLLIVFQLQRLRIRDGWRCQMPAEALGRSQDVPLRSLGPPQAQVDRIVRQPLPRSTWFWALFLVLLAPLLIGFFFRFEASCDSLLWSKTFAALFAFVLLPGSLATFSRFASLWRALRRLIVRHEWSRLLPAFQSSQEELDWHPLRAWGSGRKHNYSALVGSVELLGRLSKRPDRPRVTIPVSEMLKVEELHLDDLARTAEDALARALEANARGDSSAEAAARVDALKAVDDASQHVQWMLNSLSTHRTDPDDAALRKELTDYMALRAIAYIRYVFSVIRNSLLGFTVGILFLLAGLASFHFQPIRSVYVLLWSVIGVVAIWTVVLFVEMDRNTVMAKIAGRDPGELNPIKSGFLLRVATFVLPPVVALVATQFPQFGRPLLGWLNPMIRLFQ